MIEQDRNFDDLSERFERNIYGSAKGAIRLAVVWRHLQRLLPALAGQRPLRVLDAGCGFGQISQRLAGLGHEVVLNDLSARMVARARQGFAEQGFEPPRCIVGPVQALSAEELGRFDLVLFHAVLEWLAEPRETLRGVIDLIEPGGHLSLMFYNRDALIHRNLILGNWRKLERGSLRGEEGGLTPYHPLALAEVEAWLARWGLEVVGRAGVRVIYDYMRRDLRDSRPQEEMVAMELQYAEREPYLRLGRYHHLLVKKT